MKITFFYRLLIFAAMGIIIASSAWAQTGNCYALVIGNAEYQRISKLNNTINDAEDISAALRSLGFQVDLRRNLDHVQMVSAVDAFVTKLKSNRASEGFFWYAGHAVQVRDENYLLPVNVTIDSERLVQATSFSLNTLIEELNSAKNKVNVIILDSCRDNPLPPSGRSTGLSRGLSVVRNVPSDLFIMFSTAPGEKADDGVQGKRNSPFAEAFLKYIKAQEPVTMMAADIVNETMTITEGRQRPYISGSIISEKYYSLNPNAVVIPITHIPIQSVPSPSVPVSDFVGNITITSRNAGVILINGIKTEIMVKAGGKVTVSNVPTGATEVAVLSDDGTITNAPQLVMVVQGKTASTMIGSPGKLPNSSNGDDAWKKKWLYANAWLGYGNGFNFGGTLGVNGISYKNIHIGFKTGLSLINASYIYYDDDMYGTYKLSSSNFLFPFAASFTYNPWILSIDLYGGIYLSFCIIDSGFGGIIGISPGVKLGPGILFFDSRFAILSSVIPKQLYSINLGYKIGFINKKSR